MNKKALYYYPQFKDKKMVQMTQGKWRSWELTEAADLAF